MNVTIYTDGSVKHNGKPNSYGGWACILLIEGVDRRLLKSGGKAPTSNNEMEMTAIYEALKSLKPEWAGKCEVTVYSDSQYCVNSLGKWAWSWERMKWKRPDQTPIPNLELVQATYALKKMFRVKFEWVKGHADNELNNLMDEAAGLEMRKFEGEKRDQVKWI